MSTSLDLRLAERVRPPGPGAMRQTWEHLLFLHWQWDAEAIQRTLPRGLTVDLHEGTAWIGVVPFYMSRIRPVYLPTMPWISWFLELNVRTYVIDERGRPGVWFYSLDCNRWPAVWLARTFFHLPYQHARMSASATEEGVSYRSQRRGDAPVAEYAWRCVGPTSVAEPGSLEFFLAERYRLFSVTPAGRIRSGCVHHVPYPLRRAEVDQYSVRHLELNAFAAPGRPPDHALCSRGVDVAIFGLEKAAGANPER